MTGGPGGYVPPAGPPLPGTYPPPPGVYPPAFPRVAPPSSVAATTAAILSFAGAVVMLVVAVGFVRSLIVRSIWQTYDMDVMMSTVVAVGVVGMLAAFAASAALTTGGMQMLRRRRVARKLIALGCGLALLWTLSVPVRFVLEDIHIGLDLYGNDYVGVIVVAVLLLVAAAFAVCTMVLALGSSTRRWLDPPVAP